MIGVAVVTQPEIAEHLINAATRVMGKQTNLTGIHLSGNEGPDEIAVAVRKEINITSQGILILTDLFGGTPTNASAAHCEDLHVPAVVLTGVNLPMLLSTLANRDKMDLKALAEKVMADGQKGIREARSTSGSRG